MPRPRKTTAGPKVGDIVAYGDKRIALITGAKDEDGKDEVFILEGSYGRAPRRDPADYDEQGAGQTWRPLG